MLPRKWKGAFLQHKTSVDSDFAVQLDTPEVFLQFSNTQLTQCLSPDKSRPQPQCCNDVEIQRKLFKVLPCLAAEFQLHDVLVKAHAEPLPLETFEDDETDAMSSAASCVFSHALSCGNESIFKTLEMLESEDCVVENLHASCRKVLLGAIDDIDWTRYEMTHGAVRNISEAKKVLQCAEGWREVS